MEMELKMKNEKWKMEKKTENDEFQQYLCHMRRK